MFIKKSVEETRFSTPGLKKKTSAVRKLELLSECTKAITKKPVESADTKHSTFSIYVDEKLSQLGNRGQRIAGKRIFDMLFEVEMQSERDEPVNRQMMCGTTERIPIVTSIQHHYKDNLTWKY